MKYFIEKKNFRNEIFVPSRKTLGNEMMLSLKYF